MSNRLSAEDTAFIMIDYQVGICSTIHSMELSEFKKNTILWAKCAKACNVATLITTNMENSPQGALMSEIRDCLPDAYERRVRRNGLVNAWDEQAFNAACRNLKCRNWVVGGATTDAGVASVCLSACQNGYNVYCIADACGSAHSMSDQIAWHRMQAGGVSLTTCHAVISEMAHDWSSKNGQIIYNLLMQS